MQHTFVGFGFGAIQAGLFLYEAFRCGHFARLVVAEIQTDTVARLRQHHGRYRLHIATPTGLRTVEVAGVEAFNPLVPADRAELVRAIIDADELATALPSVEFYDRSDASVARLLADGLRAKQKPAVLYAAENHNHAAERLAAAVRRYLPQLPAHVQFLNTVIGKMSGRHPDLPEWLVEEFNQILVSQIRLPGFRRGLDVFIEKADLLPFEEAKLYGHNAVHALLGYLAHRRGYRHMSQLADDPELLALGRQAFLAESRPALLARHAGLDPLFTPAGFQAYADDLLARMINPWLHDAVERVIRDPLRKLGWNDRLIGTMRLALDAGVTPIRFARGAAAAAALVPDLDWDRLWPEADEPAGRKAQLRQLIHEAHP